MVVYTTFIHKLPPTTNASFKCGRGRMYQTEDYRAFITEAHYYLPRGLKPIQKPDTLELYVDFLLIRQRDIDSGLKCLLDSLNGWLYEDDTQVVKLGVTKSVDKNNSGTRVSWCNSTTLIV
jgi:Holliday junction resolvase RusA-like endonuclease